MVTVQGVLALVARRRRWLRLDVVPARQGSGWDVVLRLDGSYADRQDAEAVADRFSALAEDLS